VSGAQSHSAQPGRSPAGASDAEASRSGFVLVIPAFNEAATLRGILRRALRYAPWIVVIDDGSSDGTAAAAQGLPVTVLVNETNLGKGRSLWRAFEHALEYGAESIVTLDADGQHAPEDIPLLLAESRRHPESIVIGARLQKRDRMPRIRYLANRFANFWIAWACGYPIVDSQSGFRVYPIRLVRELHAQHPRSARFAFESEMLIKAAAAGFGSIAVAISAIYAPDARRSHYRPVVDTMKIVLIVARSLLARGLYLPGLVRSLRRPKQALEPVRRSY
jgi:glycosyltransferase involved in cell wall biosynthesis